MKTFKHLFTVLLLLCSITASAHDFEVDGIYYNVTNSATKEVGVTYKGYMPSTYNEYTGNVIIPESVTYGDVVYSVTSIGSSAFQYCTGLTSVVIPNSITSIGSSAFYGCTSLIDLRIEDGEGTLSLDGDSKSLFYDCPLEALYLGRDLSYSSNSPFYQTILKSVVIGNTVTSIGSLAFYGCSALTSIVIPNSVTSIGSSAFSGCSALTGELLIPNSVTSIGSSAFSGCKGLTGELVIPESLTTIGYAAFYGCSGLTGDLVIPAGVTGIGDSAFRGCSGLTGLTIGSGVTSIGNYAFDGCTSLKELRLEDGEGVLSLGYNYKNNSNSRGEGLFYDCPLETLYLGRNIKYVESYEYGYSPFYENSTLKTVTIGNGVTTIGNRLFAGCANIVGELIIPNSVATIGTYAFKDCTGLTSIEIKESVTTIGSYAFSGCSGLTGELVIPNTISIIEAGTFESCANLTSIAIGEGVTSINDRAFYGCSGLTGELVIPAGVTSIGYYVFNGCTSITGLRIESSENGLSLGSGSNKGLFADCPLESLFLGRNISYGYSSAPFPATLTDVTIGENVTSIGGDAFKNCTSLKNLYIEDCENALTLGAINSSNSIFYYSPLETLHLGRDLVYSASPFSGQKTLKSVTIGNSVTKIGDSAFSGCSGLTSVEIPSSVTTIGNSAFSGCSSLSGQIVIPNSVTTIGNSAFSGCSNLIGQIVIPNSVTSLGSWVFSSCSNISNVVIGDNVTSIGENAFSNCTNLTNVLIGKSVASIGVYAFQSCSGLTDIKIPGSVTAISDRAFIGCTSLSELVIEDGDGILTMGHNDGGSMFKDCPLEIVHLGRNIEYSNASSGHYLFENQKNLKSVTIGDCVTTIDAYMFRGCTGLTNLIIGKSVETIGYTAFSGCKALAGELVIPNSVTSIEGYAFLNCSALTSLTIGSNVETIGNCAFSGCSGLTGELVIPSSVTTIAASAFYGCTGYNGDLVIPSSVTSIGESAFRGCTGFNGDLVIGEGVTNIGENAFRDCTGFAGRLVIPNSVTDIGASAFNKCSNLTTVSIGNSVENIAKTAFELCSSLKEVHVNDLAAWCRINFYGYLSNPLYYAKKLYLDDELIDELVIPEGITDIKPYAFYNCTGIKNFVIPEGVVSIGSSAFYNCQLSNRELLIPSSVESIGNSAFGSTKIVALKTKAVTPPALDTNSTFSSAVIIVPVKSIDAYKNDESWSVYAEKIVGDEHAIRTVDIKAFEGGSALRNAIGDSLTTSVYDLKVKGTINSYDAIILRTKMPLLCNLDLSEATIVASEYPYYNSDCTQDNILGSGMFKGTGLINVVLPNNITEIGSSAFSGCKSLKSVNIPNGVTRIGGYAFYQCTSLTGELVIPNSVTSIDGYAFFSTGIESVVLPDKLQRINYNTFYKCSRLSEVKLPSTLKSIETAAFKECTSLQELRIPSSMEKIASDAFSGSALKNVYTYTVEPMKISDGLFPLAASGTLYAPTQSRENYYFAAGWNSFLDFKFFDEPYEYFYVNNDYILDENTGYIEGVDGNAPDADINAGGGFIVEGEQGDGEVPNQSLGNVNVGCDGDGNSASIIGDNNLHIDDLNIKIDVKGGRWYFFAFPFDIKMEKISMQNGSDYVFRYYDGEERAKNGNGGWKDVNESHLKAARGYIFHCSANDVLVLNIEDVKFKKEDKYNELVAHVSENLKDASWNFTGNPYLSYYDMADMDYTAPVTVWDGSKYVAIRPGDDDYHFAPYEAFFVQKPEGQDEITFDGEEQMTQNQSEKKMEKQAAARRARSVDTGRMLVNIVLGDGTTSDRTRIVFNERQSLAYETACDATKFETAGVAQIYTIGSDNVRYAINERPADNGRVVLGYSVPAAGMFTIDAARMDVAVVLVDTKNGTVHDFTNGGYTFSSDAGTYNNRFEIKLKAGATGIDEVEGEPTVDAGQNGEVKGEIYDLQGRKLNRTDKGIYIINGEKVMK